MEGAHNHAKVVEQGTLIIMCVGTCGWWWGAGRCLLIVVVVGIHGWHWMLVAMIDGAGGHSSCLLVVLVYAHGIMVTDSLFVGVHGGSLCFTGAIVTEGSGESFMLHSWVVGSDVQGFANP